MERGGRSSSFTIGASLGFSGGRVSQVKRGRSELRQFTLPGVSDPYFASRGRKGVWPATSRSSSGVSASGACCHRVGQRACCGLAMGVNTSASLGIAGHRWVSLGIAGHCWEEEEEETCCALVIVD